MSFARLFSLASEAVTHNQLGPRMVFATTHLYHLSIFSGVIPADRITYLIDRRTLLRQVLRHQRLPDADFAPRAVVTSITIQQILMALHPVTSAIAMQLRQQHGILLRNLVRLL